jgi:hypothetical protein
MMGRRDGPSAYSGYVYVRLEDADAGLYVVQFYRGLADLGL